MIQNQKFDFKAAVMIPAFNEQGRIGQVVHRVREFVDDILVVDDGSTDATAAEAEAAGARVIKHEGNRGKGVALNTGFADVRARGFDVVITLDADGQHDPADLPRFLEAYQRTGFPVLVGNRMASSDTMPLVRRMTNRFMSWLLSREMKQYVPDTQCGYRLFRCDVIPLVATHSERFAAESEILLHVAERGIRIGAIGVATIYRDEKSKISPIKDTLRFFRMLSDYRRNRRQRLRR